VEPILQPRKSQKAVLPVKKTFFSLFSKSLAATFILGCAIIYASYSTGNINFSITPPLDNITQKQRDDLSAAFNVLAPIPMKMVEEKEVPSAIENMNLSAAAKHSLLLDLAKTPSAQPAAIQVAPQQKNPVRLAWITLWDTDAEDGDTVKIESQGYSRTVILKKTPVTFAVPVSTSGIINVTGISDGDGGGITVGIASGDRKAVFPVMSEGQVLGLRVQAN